MALLAASVCTFTLGILPHGVAAAQSLRGVNAATAGGGTLVLKGNLTSTSELTMTGAFSVGNASNLHWDLPRVTPVHESGYSEDLDAMQYAFTVQPDSFVDTVVDGRAVREFVWNNPPSQTVIHVTETLKVVTSTDLTPFHSVAPYPVTQLTDDSMPWLAVTPLVTLPAAADSLIDSFKHGATSEQSVVTAVLNWVASNTTYDGTRTGETVSASSVFTSHRAICRGFVNIAVGMLRRLGIPARVEFGWVSANRLNLPGPKQGHSYVQWAVPGTQGESHTWLSVYFPDSGWVPADPQREKFFVDPHHIAFYSALDAGAPTMGAWTAQYANGQNLTGPALSNGGEEIVPGDGVDSQVTIKSHDSVHVTLQAYKRDVHDVLLFAR